VALRQINPNLVHEIYGESENNDSFEEAQFEKHLAFEDDYKNQDTNARNKDVRKLREKRLRDYQAHLERLVANKEITEEQADQHYQEMTEELWSNTAGEYGRDLNSMEDGLEQENQQDQLKIPEHCPVCLIQSPEGASLSGLKSRKSATIKLKIDVAAVDAKIGAMKRYAFSALEPAVKGSEKGSDLQAFGGVAKEVRALKNFGPILAVELGEDDDHY